MFRNALKNLLTTVFGGTGGGALVLEGLQTKNWALIIGGAGVFLASLFTQDAKSGN